MTLGAESYDLSPGDTLWFGADVPHVYESRSACPTRCLNVISYPRS